MWGKAKEVLDMDAHYQLPESNPCHVQLVSQFPQGQGRGTKIE